jgi:alpha-amylase
MKMVLVINFVGDFNSLIPDSVTWRIKDTPFNHEVDLENGNYDYLMGCDLNVDHPEVRGELIHGKNGCWKSSSSSMASGWTPPGSHRGGIFNDWLDRKN